MTWEKKFVEELEAEIKDSFRRMVDDEELARRFGHTPPSEAGKELIEKTRLAFRDMAWFVDTYIPYEPNSARAKALALTALEEAAMWAVKAIALGKPEEVENVEQKEQE